MADLYEITKRYRERLLRRETRVVKEMLGDWRRVELDLMARATAIGNQIEQAALAGVPIDPVWLFQQERVEALLEQARLEMASFSDKYSQYLVDQSRGAALDGAQLAARQLKVGTTFGTSLSASAVESIAAATRIGPVADLLASIDVSGMLRDALITGIARGANPRAVAREVARATNLAKSKTLTIARTEMARAQRQATYDSYRAAGVASWQWLSAQDASTCAACWAMDGQVFPVDQEVDDHPNGRCAIVPVTEGEQLATLPDKQQAWNALSDSERMRILGPSRYEALQSGESTLAQMGKVYTDPNGIWGSSIRVSPLSDITGMSVSSARLPAGTAVTSPIGTTSATGTRFASRQEAEQYIRDTFVRETGYDGRPLQRGFTAPTGAAKVKISSKTEMEMVEIITDEMDKVLSELAETAPQMFDEFRFAGVEIKGSSTREAAHVFCYADGRGNPQWLVFRGDSHGTVEGWVERIRETLRAAEAGEPQWAWYFDPLLPADSAGAQEAIRRLVRHELGHTAQNLLGRGSEAATEWFYATSEAARNGFRISRFSTYGRKDAQEFFAECFSYYWTDPANTRGFLPPEILNWFRKYLPRRGM